MPEQLFGKSYFPETKKNVLVWFRFSYFNLPVASENTNRAEDGNTTPTIALKLVRHHFLDNFSELFIYRVTPKSEGVFDTSDTLR